MPPALPVVGNMLSFKPSRMHLILEEWAERYGTPYRVRMASRNMLVIDDHEEVARIMKARPGAFRRCRPVESVFRELGVAGLFSSEGENWERQRRLVMKAFDPKHLRHYFPSLGVVTGRLQQRFAKAASAGAALDLAAEFMRYTLDVTAGLAFGADINTLENDADPLQRYLDKVFPAINRRMNSVYPYWRYLKLPSDRALDRDLAQVRRAIDGFVVAARARMVANPALAETPTNLLEALLAARDRPGSEFSEADVSGNVFTALLAGEDTTANTLAWLCYYLCEHPQVQGRVRDEVLALTQGAPLDFAQADELPYLDAAIREAMRLKPVAPLLVHETTEAVEVMGIPLRKGTPVATLLRRMGMEATAFPNPSVFLPERWLGEDHAIQASAKKRLMPFGGGPRFCPGRYLAMLEIKMVTAMLVTQFTLTRDTSSAVSERFALSMMPDGLRVLLRAR